MFTKGLQGSKNGLFLSLAFASGKTLPKANHDEAYLKGPVVGSIAVLETALILADFRSTGPASRARACDTVDCKDWSHCLGIRAGIGSVSILPNFCVRYIDER